MVNEPSRLNASIVRMCSGARMLGCMISAPVPEPTRSALCGITDK